jgi:hypothetical protein
MPSQNEEFRRAAAECLLLAATTTDPATKAKLISMAPEMAGDV